ncbi:MAG: PhzF family phenazine biosynthesis protein [Halobacteriaceae archaeon]
MDRRRILLVDAFSESPLAGNAAGVVPEAAGLSTGQMRAIAAELAVSETAFILPSETADRQIRYFTPSTEVDLCGHATIASHAHLLEDGVLAAGTHTLETPVGVIDVEVTPDEMVWMTQDTPRVETVTVDSDRLAAALDLPVAALDQVELPTAVASTGVSFLVVPVTFLEPLGGADPDDDAVAAIADEYDAAGIYAFTFDTIDAESTLHARCFAPGLGIAEDPVTGTASGAAAAYLRTVDAFDSLPEQLRFEQGHFIDRPGHVAVRAHETIQVGGRATTSVDGELRVPPDTDDEIITPEG